MQLTHPVNSGILLSSALIRMKPFRELVSDSIETNVKNECQYDQESHTQCGRLEGKC